MPRLLTLILAALLTAANADAQNFGVARFDSIVGSPTEYYKYLDKFARGEERLTAAECIIAYYGFAYQDYFTGGNVEGETQMQEAILDGDFPSIFEYGNRVLAKDPVNLTALYWTLAAATETKQPWEVRNSLKTRYNNVTVAISLSGDGLTRETAFWTVHIGDMYMYCQMELEVDIFDRYLWDGRYDMFEIGPSVKFPHATIYFDNFLTYRKSPPIKTE